jgi:hypothetical protein
MVNVEGPVDNFVSALKFGVSNVASLAIWGISYVVAIFVSVFIMVFAWLFLNDNLPVVIVLSILAFLPAMAVGILLLGFISQCLKTVLDGDDKMPTGLESPADLVKGGIMTFIIALEGVVLEMVCLSPAVLLIFIAGPKDDVLIWVALALMLLAIPVILIIFLLNVIQWAVYADTGSLMQGLNPLKPVSLVLSNPGGAVVMIVSVIAAYLFFSVVTFICELLVITILLLPFLLVAMYASLMYLIAVFYRQSCGDGSRDIRDAVTGGYSVS